MKAKQVENYLKSSINDVLYRIKTFEKRVLDDRDYVEEARERILKHKSAKGDWKEVKEDLIGIQKTHYYSFLLEQDLRNEHIRARELLTQANLFSIDLGLEGEDVKAVENILNTSVGIFDLGKDEDGNETVGLLDSPLRAQIEFGIESKLKDEKGLQEIFKNLAPARPMQM